jgi:hypothetical protein
MNNFPMETITAASNRGGVHSHGKVALILNMRMGGILGVIITLILRPTVIRIPGIRIPMTISTGTCPALSETMTQLGDHGSIQVLETSTTAILRIRTVANLAHDPLFTFAMSNKATLSGVTITTAMA